MILAIRGEFSSKTERIAFLHSFVDVTIIINAHTMSFAHKNPEYTIDGQLGDRKGIITTSRARLGVRPLRNAFSYASSASCRGHRTKRRESS